MKVRFNLKSVVLIVFVAIVAMLATGCAGLKVHERPQEIVIIHPPACPKKSICEEQMNFGTNNFNKWPVGTTGYTGGAHADWHKAPAQDRPYNKDTWQQEQNERALQQARVNAEIRAYNRPFFTDPYANDCYGYDRYGYGPVMTAHSSVFIGAGYNAYSPGAYHYSRWR